MHTYGHTTRQTIIQAGSQADRCILKHTESYKRHVYRAIYICRDIYTESGMQRQRDT